MFKYSSDNVKRERIKKAFVMKSLIVLIFSFPSLVTVFCAHYREKEVFERVCSFPCHNWTRLALIFMMF